MKLDTLAVLALGLGLAASALAHDEASLDAMKAPNGGQLRAVGMYHYELVVDRNAKGASASPIAVYLTDHGGNKVSSAGATGTVTVLSGKSKSTATLQPDGDNRMKGQANYASTPDMKVVVSIALPGKPAEQARFTPLAGPAAVHAHN